MTTDTLSKQLVNEIVAAEILANKSKDPPPLALGGPGATLPENRGRGEVRRF